MIQKSELSAALNSPSARAPAENGAGAAPHSPLDAVDLPAAAFPCLTALDQEEGLGRARSSFPDQPEAQQERRRSLAREPLPEQFWARMALPDGLGQVERHRRKSLSSEVPGSLTAQDAAARPPAEVAAPTAAGRKLRQKLCRGRVVVCLVTGYRGKRHIYERARELGLRVVILDSADSWAVELETEGVIARFLPFDFSAPDTLERCLDALRSVEADLGPVDAVVTYFEFAARLVALVAERLGLPGNPPHALETAQNKQATREAMARAGLPTPAHAEIRRREDLASAAEAVGFPAVLKPTSGGASQGVVKVADMGELEGAFERELSRFTEQGRESSGAFGQGNRGLEPEIRFMLEAYLDGDEVDVDFVLRDGQPTYGNIVDNWPTIEPYFNETGSNCPSTLPRDGQRRLLQLSTAAVQCLGFETGVFHVECKLGSHGPHLIEINPRLGGGPVSQMNALVWGVDLVEEQFLAALGIPSQPHLATRPEKYIAEYTINSVKSGTLKDNRAIEKWERAEGVVYCRALEPAGARVRGPQDGLPTWLAEVMVSSEVGTEAAIERVKEIQADLEKNLNIEGPAGE